MKLSSHSTRESRENLNSKIFENLKNPTVIFSNFENLTVKNSNSYFWDYIHNWRSRSIEDNLRIENLVVWRSNSICTTRKVYVKSNKLSKKRPKTSKNVKISIFEDKKMISRLKTRQSSDRERIKHV